MKLFSDPSFLSSVGQLLLVLGVVGQLSLFFFPAGRRFLERSLGVIFTVVAIGGVGLAWRAQDLRDADRDLTPAQQTALGAAMGQFPGVKYEVLTSRADPEAYALALKIADAVKAGSGAMPVFSDALPTPPPGRGAGAARPRRRARPGVRRHGRTGPHGRPHRRHQRQGDRRRRQHGSDRGRGKAVI